MKNKHGFTMVELIITMGIIGVVAALVIPTFSKGIEKASRRPALTRTINWFQSGLINIISHNHRTMDRNYTGEITTLAPIMVNDVTEELDSNNCNTPEGGWTEANPKPAACKYVTEDMALFDSLSHVMEIARVQDTDFKKFAKASKYLEAIDKPEEITNIGAFQIYKPKKIKTYIIVEPMNDYNIRTYIEAHPNASDDVAITRILIDTNGEKMPNKVNEDIYLYGLSNDGQLYEFGSASYNKHVW